MLINLIVMQHPPTVIRAMVLRECGLEAGMRTTLYKALRERREEIKGNEANKAGLLNESVEAVTEKSVKKNGGSGKGAGRRGAMPSRGRKSRAVTASGVVGGTSVDAKAITVDGRMEHQVSGEEGRNGPFMSLI